MFGKTSCKCGGQRGGVRPEAEIELEGEGGEVEEDSRDSSELESGRG